DRMFLLEVGLRDPKVHYVPGCAGYWTRHADQMQANYHGLKSDAVNWQHLQLYRRILSQLEEDDPRTKARRQAACQVLWPLAHWIAKTRPQDAYALVDWIFDLDPAFSPPDRGLLGF